MFLMTRISIHGGNKMYKDNDVVCEQFPEYLESMAIHSIVLNVNT